MQVMAKKLLTGLAVVMIGVIGIVIVLANEKALVVHPRGIIAQQELELIITNILLMLAIIIPAYILLFWIVWKYCIKQENIKYDPDCQMARRMTHFAST